MGTLTAGQSIKFKFSSLEQMVDTIRRAEEREKKKRKKNWLTNTVRVCVNGV